MVINSAKQLLEKKLPLEYPWHDPYLSCCLFGGFVPHCCRFFFFFEHFILLRKFLTTISSYENISCVRNLERYDHKARQLS